jgi:hypothetical protein
MKFTFIYNIWYVFYVGLMIISLYYIHKVFVGFLREKETGILTRVSFETSFDSKQPKLEPKLVSALSETKRLFWLFRFYTETESFDVSIEPKQTKDQPKQFLLSQFKCCQYPIDVLRVTAPTGCSSQIDIFLIYTVKRPKFDTLFGEIIFYLLFFFS